MKALAIIKKILYSTAFAFTVTVFAFLALLSIASDNTETAQTMMIPLGRYPWILLFSLIVGAMNHLLTVPSIPLSLRLTSHMIGVLGAFYIIMLRVFGLGQNGSGRLSVMLVAALIYVITLTTAYFVRKAFKKAASKTE